MVSKAVSAYKPNSTNILLTTNHGQVLLATLFGIPMSAKLKLLKSQDGHTFRIPHKLTLSRDELAMIAIAWEIAEELYSFSGKCTRMNKLYDDIRDNASAYTENGHTILSGLHLITREVKKHASKIKIANTTSALLLRRSRLSQGRSLTLLLSWV